MKKSHWNMVRTALLLIFTGVILMTLGSFEIPLQRSSRIEQTQTDSDGPSQITGLKAEKRSGGVRLSWDPDEKAEGYCIFRWDEKTSQYRTYKFSEQPWKSFSGLTDGQEYIFSVAGYRIKNHQEIYGDFSQSVRVSPGSGLPELSESFLCLNSGETHLLECLVQKQPQKNVVWTSSNPEVASVNEDGMVRGISKGRAVIQASFQEKIFNCPVEVDRKSPERRTDSSSRYIQKQNGIWTNGKDGDTASLMFTGDLMALSPQILAAETEDGWYDFSSSFSKVSGLFKTADFVAGNLETTLSQSFPYHSESPSYLGICNCNAPSSYLDALKNAGFDLLTTANNHYCDSGPVGVKETLDHLDSYGFMHNGTYRSSSDSRPVVAEINGIKVGFITYNQKSANGKDAMFTEKEQNEMLGKWYRSRAQKDIQTARDLGAEFIIAFIHYGTQNSVTLNETQKSITKYLADCGADLIVGSHPHLLQEYGEVKAEDGRNVPVLYSMGNFCSSMAELTLNRYNIILNAVIKRENDKVVLSELSYIPCCILPETKEGNYIITPVWEKKGLSAELQEELSQAGKMISEILGSGISSSIPEKGR